MIEHTLDTARSILLLRPKSALEQDDFVQLAKAIDPYIEETGDLAGLIIEAPKFPGWDSLGAMAAHFRFVRDHHRHIRKIALVTDSALGDVAERLASHFVSAVVRHFPANDLEAAKQWVMTRSASLSAVLPGTWELLSRIDVTDSGERRVDSSLGSDPIAILIYDRSGHFAAQFMKRDRSTPVADAPAVGANNSRAQCGYDAYFGTYTVDDRQGTVTQRLVGALSPENVGNVLTRAMKVDGDTLTIRLRTTSATGEPLTRTLAWSRVG